MLRYIPLMLLLVACATPQERCINDAAAPYRSALKERAKIAETLARGFTYKTEYETRRVFSRSRIGPDTFVPCWDRETVPVTKRIAVDADALRARDAQLARDLPNLQRAAERGAYACAQAFAKTAP
ncbi:excinuclease ABC subunit B [Marivita sp. S6314]|uniref:excinuclease ABC subunit B n=1 Tax=Marivita sp. S6314 TaxID=2926406 RepID=UPI001FF6B0C7|nr:excinuclease ABC subunit B [Marivita sp. S6314]MCK0149745.1 excinuclease ABC subunit B [Marivita sp. S6314]